MGECMNVCNIELIGYSGFVLEGSEMYVDIN